MADLPRGEDDHGSGSGSGDDYPVVMVDIDEDEAELFRTPSGSAAAHPSPGVSTDESLTSTPGSEPRHAPRSLRNMVALAAQTSARTKLSPKKAPQLRSIVRRLQDERPAPHGEDTVQSLTEERDRLAQEVSQARANLRIVVKRDKEIEDQMNEKINQLDKDNTYLRNALATERSNSKHLYVDINRLRKLLQARITALQEEVEVIRREKVLLITEKEERTTKSKSRWDALAEMCRNRHREPPATNPAEELRDLMGAETADALREMVESARALLALPAQMAWEVEREAMQRRIQELELEATAEVENASGPSEREGKLEKALKRYAILKRDGDAKLASVSEELEALKAQHSHCTADLNAVREQMAKVELKYAKSHTAEEYDKLLAELQATRDEKAAVEAALAKSKKSYKTLIKDVKKMLAKMGIVMPTKDDAQYATLEYYVRRAKQDDQGDGDSATLAMLELWKRDQEVAGELEIWRAPTGTPTKAGSASAPLTADQLAELEIWRRQQGGDAREFVLANTGPAAAGGAAAGAGGEEDATAGDAPAKSPSGGSSSKRARNDAKLHAFTRRHSVIALTREVADLEAQLQKGEVSPSVPGGGARDLREKGNTIHEENDLDMEIARLQDKLSMDALEQHSLQKQVHDYKHALALQSQSAPDAADSPAHSEADSSLRRADSSFLSGDRLARLAALRKKALSLNAEAAVGENARVLYAKVEKPEAVPTLDENGDPVLPSEEDVATAETHKAVVGATVGELLAQAASLSPAVGFAMAVAALQAELADMEAERATWVKAEARLSERLAKEKEKRRAERAKVETQLGIAEKGNESRIAALEAEVKAISEAAAANEQRLQEKLKRERERRQIAETALLEGSAPHAGDTLNVSAKSEIEDLNNRLAALEAANASLMAEKSTYAVNLAKANAQMAGLDEQIRAMQAETEHTRQLDEGRRERERVQQAKLEEEVRLARAQALVSEDELRRRAEAEAKLTEKLRKEKEKRGAMDTKQHDLLEEIERWKEQLKLMTEKVNKEKEKRKAATEKLAGVHAELDAAHAIEERLRARTLALEGMIARENESAEAAMRQKTTMLEARIAALEEEKKQAARDKIEVDTEVKALTSKLKKEKKKFEEREEEHSKERIDLEMRLRREHERVINKETTLRKEREEKMRTQIEQEEQARFVAEAQLAAGRRAARQLSDEFEDGVTEKVASRGASRSGSRALSRQLSTTDSREVEDIRAKVLAEREQARRLAELETEAINARLQCEALTAEVADHKAKAGTMADELNAARAAAEAAAKALKDAELAREVLSGKVALAEADAAEANKALQAARAAAMESPASSAITTPAAPVPFPAMSTPPTSSPALATTSKPDTRDMECQTTCTCACTCGVKSVRFAEPPKPEPAKLSLLAVPGTAPAATPTIVAPGALKSPLRPDAMPTLQLLPLDEDGELDASRTAAQLTEVAGLLSQSLAALTGPDSTAAIAAGLDNIARYTAEAQAESLGYAIDDWRESLANQTDALASFENARVDGHTAAQLVEERRQMLGAWRATVNEQTSRVTDLEKERINLVDRPHEGGVLGAVFMGQTPEVRPRMRPKDNTRKMSRSRSKVKLPDDDNRSKRERELDRIAEDFHGKNLTPADLIVYRNKFIFYDKDGSGDIDLRELSLMMEEIGQPKTHLELKSMMKKYAGADGTVGFREFLNMVVGGGDTVHGFDDPSTGRFNRRG